jgi:predicted DNA-binding protein
LCNALHVGIERGHLAKRRRLAQLGKLGEGKTVVFKRNAANGQSQANRLGAATVPVEIRKFGLGHGFGPDGLVWRVLPGGGWILGGWRCVVAHTTVALNIGLRQWIKITYYRIVLQNMSAATLSFRAPLDFAEQTKLLARTMSMSASDYVREAVREKNERALKDRIVFLSRQLSVQHLLENQAMDGSLGDGLV